MRAKPFPRDPRPGRVDTARILYRFRAIGDAEDVPILVASRKRSETPVDLAGPDLVGLTRLSAYAGQRVQISRNAALEF